MKYNFNELKIKDLKTLSDSGLEAIIDGDLKQVIISEAKK